MFLGCLVITASHNPYNWLGLKIKSFKGCSVDESFTREVEKRLLLGNSIERSQASYEKVDIKKFHLDQIKANFNLDFIVQRLKKMNLHIFIDSMHGSAANCISQIFEDYDSKPFTEIRVNYDPFFGGILQSHFKKI